MKFQLLALTSALTLTLSVSPAQASPRAQGDSGGDEPEQVGPTDRPLEPGEVIPTLPRSRAPIFEDPLGWQQWWSLNREPFLNLKAAVHRAGADSGESDFFIGRGEKSDGPPSLRPAEGLLRDEVVPALLAVLRDETQKDLVAGALLALGKVGTAGESPGGPALRDVIEPFLASGNQEIAESAVLALGILADARSTRTLAALLADSSDGRRLAGMTRVPERLRAFAAYGLGLLGHRHEIDDVRSYVVQQLVLTLDGHDQGQADVPVACVFALGLVPLEVRGTRATSDVVPDPWESREGQLAFLTAWLGDRRNSDRIRAHVPVALARLAVQAEGETRAAAVERLVSIARPRSGQDRVLVQSAVNALGILGDGDDQPQDEAIRDVLQRVAERGEDYAQRLAYVALAEVSARRGSEDTDEAVEAARKFLLGKLQRGGSALRPWAALALGVLEDRVLREGRSPSDEVRAALRKLLAAASTKEQEGAAAIALGLCRDISAEEALLELVTEGSDDPTRGHAAVALGLMDARSSIPALREVVQEAEYRPRLLLDGAIGLALLSDKQMIGHLSGLLARSRSLAVQRSVATALGFVGDRRAVAPLVELVRNEDLAGVPRALAATALGIVCDKEPYPFNAKFAVHANVWLAPRTLFDPAGGGGLLNIL